VRLGRRQGRTPVAVVVTKMDAVRQTQGMPRPAQAGDGKSESENVEAWLKDIGLRNLTTSLAHDFGAVEYWAVSAYTSAEPGAAGLDRDSVARPLVWLLAQT
jgi:hypothetical protein